MDSITQHKRIVRELINEIADMTPSDQWSETQKVTDDEHGHYLLLSVGWGDQHREYLPFVHIDVREDSRVLIQHDGTDLKIANLLIEKGIAKNSIVLAFHDPESRKLIPEFAIA